MKAMRKLRTAMTSPTVIRAQVRPYISKKEKMRSRAEKFKDFLKRETKIALYYLPGRWKMLKKVVLKARL